MTKTEIIEFMRNNEGARVTHWLFAPEEYLYMKNGVIYTEEDYLFDDFYSENRADGMRIRDTDVWQSGWKEYKD